MHASRAHHAVPPISDPGDFARKVRVSTAYSRVDLRLSVSGRRNMPNSGPGLWPKKFCSWRQEPTEDGAYDASPSLAYCRDHSAGASRRFAMPTPRGRRPSIAACTRFGARNASDIVILICRTLQFSVRAICSTFVAVPAINSSNGGLLPGQNLTPEVHFPNVEPVTEQVGQRTARERNAANCLAGLQDAYFGDDAPLTQADHQPV